MTATQIWAFAVFVAILLLVALVMTPKSRKLDGRQRYSKQYKRDIDPDENNHRGRPDSNMTPLAMLALLFGGGVNSSGSNDAGADVGGDGGGE